MKIIKECYKLGLFKASAWPVNIIAGLIVGVIALPLAMAFAIASGAKPEQGIYTAIVAGIVVSLFGGSRVQIAGPTGAFIVLLSGITAKYGIDGLQLVTLMAGAILIIMGLCRFGSIMQFIPYPVILGFTAGIALVIWVGQWPSFLGLPAISAEHFYEKFWKTCLALPQTNLHTLILASIGLGICILVPKLPYLKRIPGPLIALLFVSFLHNWLDWAGVKTIGQAYGGIPSGLPHLHLPHWTLHQAIELLGPAFSVALLGAIESLLSALVADGMLASKHHPNQELIGQGLANMLLPFANGFAATGAIARTATNIRNGGRTPIAGVVHSLCLIFILVYLAPMAAHIPLAVLASILFMVCWNMSELKHCIQLIKQAPKSDVLIMLITFTLTVMVDLVFAVQIGVLIAIIYFLVNMAKSIDIELHELKDLGENHETKGYQGTTLVYKIQGPIFFGAVERLEQAMQAHSNEVKTIILRFGWVPMIDITALRCLEKLIQNWQAHNINVKLSGLNAIVRQNLKKSGLLQKIGEHNILAS